MILQDTKLTDQTAGHEIPKHENAGHEENSKIQRLFIIIISFQCRLA